MISGIFDVLTSIGDFFVSIGTFIGDFLSDLVSFVTNLTSVGKSSYIIINWTACVFNYWDCFINSDYGTPSCFGEGLI